MRLVGVLERVLGREAEVPLPAPPEVPPMSKQDELRLMEKRVLEKGISNEEFVRIQREGDCEFQVQTRIAKLHAWDAAHL